MKPAYLILGIPVFAFLVVAFVLDFGSLLPLYPDLDLTPYLAARSLAKDHDLAYTRTDSDRFFRENLYRPYPLLLVQKRIVSSSGEYKSYVAYYSPDIYVFVLAPFVALFSIHGILLLHTILIGWFLFIGYRYYSAAVTDPVLRSINALTYCWLTLLPVLYLLPSHHLFLFVAVSTAVYYGLKGHVMWSALWIGIAFSLQPWALLIAVFLIGCWQRSHVSESTSIPLMRFGIAVFLCVGAIWGMERLMYPPKSILEPRWMNEKLDVPLAQVWETLPLAGTHLFGKPNLQKLSDFVFGRSTGFFVYGFTACAILLSSVWFWRSRIVQSGLLFLVFFFISICFTDPGAWHVLAFTNDFSVIICAIPFFLLPVIQPWSQYVLLVALSAFFAGPLLINPLGAITSRSYYVQSFPYRYFPIEISLAGKVGIMRNKPYQLEFPGGTVYFLNDNFYIEEDFFWVRGESEVEVLIGVDRSSALPRLQIANGPFENRIVTRFSDLKKEFTAAPAQSAVIDLSVLKAKAVQVDGVAYLHGTISAKSGFVPKLFSRDNLDYRYLGCQIHVIQGELIHAP